MRSYLWIPIILFGTSNGFADIVLTIDLDRSTAGLQTTLDNVSAGQTIEAAVNLEITETSLTGLGAYSMTIIFDSDKLDLGPDTFVITNPLPPFDNLNVNRLANPPSNFSTLGDQTGATDTEGPIDNPGVPIFFTNTGAFYNVAAGASSGGVGPGTNVQILDFNLTATTGGTISSVFDANPDVLLALVQPSDGFIDATVESNPIPFSQIQGVAVPESSSLAFLGLGALLVARRRYKKRRSAKAMD
jgi:hypothetical protein